MNKDQLVPKSEANYKIDAAGTQPCSGCKNFVAPDACSLVDGTIAPNGTCDLYEASDAGTGDMMSMLFGGSNG